MDRALSIIGAIIAAAGFLGGVLFFAATQEPVERDWLVLGFGSVLGALLVAVFSVLIFYSDRRARRKEQQRSEGEARTAAIAAKGEADAAATEVEAKARRSVVLMEGRARADGIADADRRKRDLLVVLPLRSERLKELRGTMGEFRKAAASARAAVTENQAAAADALRAEYPDLAAAALGQAEVSRLEADEFDVEVAKAAEELAEVEALTDEEFLQRTKHLRGLD